MKINFSWKNICTENDFPGTIFLLPKQYLSIIVFWSYNAYYTGLFVKKFSTHIIFYQGMLCYAFTVNAFLSYTAYYNILFFKKFFAHIILFQGMPCYACYEEALGHAYAL